MKLIYIFLITFVLQFLFSNQVYSYTDSLIVKLKIAPDNVDLSSYFLNFRLTRLIRPQLLTLNEAKLKVQKNIIQSQMKELSHVFLLEYNSSFPQAKIIKTLEQLNYFQYVERYPERKLCLIPNDSLYSQQYYMNVLRVSDAWDSLQTKIQIIVGVVDTGVDYDHPDLKDNIWVNLNETGIDKNGNDKRTNGIDDDENGFTDDWHGWDFMADSLGEDNDPFPGHPHGTHVSGTIGAVINNTIGIAGMCDSIKILPLKAGSDSPFSTSLRNTYEAILYGSKMGASVINCSWGGTSHSQTEQDVISAAINLGTTIIAAAGNSSEDVAFYPAAYDGVISVAATDSSDTKTFFSNYNSTVDISAPGIDIISTTPWNSYASWMGTSMASPIVAGVAAMIKMVHPEYSAIQVGEHLKATATDINPINPDYMGKLGKGRVNAFKAVTEKYPKNILVKEITLQNELNNGRYESKQKCFISIELENLLTTLSDFKIYVRALGNSDISFTPDIINHGIFQQYSVISVDKGIEFTLPQFNELDSRVELEFYFFDGFEIINQAILSFYVDPSYLTFDNNLISTTFNSTGNIGYNDYPNNEQGIGFSFDSTPNILFEGSLMISSDTLLADVARNGSQSMQNRGLVMHKNLQYLPLMNPSLLAGTAEMVDNPFIAYPPGIKVNQMIYQQKIPNNVIYTIYDVINTKDYIQDSVYVGLYFDWDIGISGTDNITFWDKETQSAIVQNLMIDSLPKISVKMLSNFKNNYWAIDNDGTTDENPGVWDGFTDSEKMIMLKSGIGRDTSGITDVSVVISAGPIFMEKGDTARVCFAFTADYNLNDLIKSTKNAETFAHQINLDNGEYNLPIEKSRILNIYPNPINTLEKLNIIFELINETNFSIDIYDLLGNKVDNIVSGNFSSGKYIINWFPENLAIGSYYIRLKAGLDQSSVPIIIYK